ncbi:hypothetical protein M0802_010935 [Mischocyttarus mexicanus]|nr:hypothetical protein M0802_010935 [Mischocyttarus mexicanus]
MLCCVGLETPHNQLEVNDVQIDIDLSGLIQAVQLFQDNAPTLWAWRAVKSPMKTSRPALCMTPVLGRSMLGLYDKLRMMRISIKDSRECKKSILGRNDKGDSSINSNSNSIITTVNPVLATVAVTVAVAVATEFSTFIDAHPHCWFMLLITEKPGERQRSDYFAAISRR